MINLKKSKGHKTFIWNELLQIGLVPVTITLGQLSINDLARLIHIFQNQSLLFLKKWQCKWNKILAYFKALHRMGPINVKDGV